MFKRKKNAAVAGEAKRDRFAALGDPVDLVKQFPLYSAKEIKAMQKQFYTWLMDTDPNEENVEVACSVLVSQPDVRLNKLFALALYDLAGHTASFQDYLQVLTAFHRKTSLPEKRTALFRLYDVDKDGVVSPADVARILNKCHSDSMLSSIDVDMVAPVVRSFMKSSATGLSQAEFNQVRAYAYKLEQGMVRQR
ncbi:Aste57867_18153 [Aphanomyces stellatus]|uniref:Aste57867_18153 protein n=1 Tax=Aphanomyces stellatus TaxID=120398 RepID=A0A485LAQ5_9STRA|nr:hypothetical protein As57867_018091 [Aphanomyces stellatus]VFT94891.1 Aste57867_18153 [Aphanomyces stellatus]